jgi:hypothetical protein
MLHVPLNSIVTLMLVFTCGTVSAQVTLDAPLRFTGDAQSSGIEGLAAPVVPSAAITVDYAALGASHWSQASLSADTIELVTEPAVAAYRDGLLVRFLMPIARYGRTWVRVDAGPAVPLVGGDSLAPVLGELTVGALCEVVLVNGKAVLMSPHVRGCPPNSVPVNQSFCIQTNRKTAVDHLDASQYCAERGGRLCTWDEYYAACTLTTGQLTGQFADWEWINDTSDHTHTANQMGRTSCTSQRTSGYYLQSSARCCYRMR